MKFLSSTKFLMILIALSVVVVAVGAWMVNKSVNTPVPAVPNIDLPMPAPQVDTAPFEKIADEAEAGLRQALQQAEGPIALELSQQHKAELQSRYKDAIPDVGTQEWCDYMMIKENAEWTDTDKGNFARNCI